VLARSTEVRHPLGITLPTPLLIPSFSSKGFGFLKGQKSEVGQLFSTASEYLTESVLLSAYDIFHRHIRRPARGLTSITFVDSGGYETAAWQDLSATFVQPTGGKRWSEKALRSVYDGWPSRQPAVFVNYDARGPIETQIDAAAKLLARYEEHLHCFLLKPRGESSKEIDVHSLCEVANKLDPFDILGVTEKELGRSTLDRMVNVARIRLALDRANLRRIPIHVFGSLDPLSVPFYFIAGAEVFDGLTWLRFGYDAGNALYQQNWAARRLGVQHTDDQVKLLLMQQNLVGLSDLAARMRRFLNNNDFRQLEPNDRILEDAYGLLRNRVPEAA